MYEKILVPLDGSDLAEVALPYAEELMRRLHSELVLLRVCGSSDKPEQREYLDLLAADIRQRAAKRTEIAGGAVRVATLVLEGNPAERIIDCADRNDIDLTIMATHGRSGISRWALGSVADKVVRGTCRPIALIRAKGSQAEVRPDCLVSRIFVPLDGSEAGEAALSYIEELASKVQAEVVLFQMVANDEFAGEVNFIDLRQLSKRHTRYYLRKVEQRLQSKGIAVRVEVEFGGRPAQRIIDLAAQTRSAVIAMSTHGRSGVDRWVLGSVADKVLHAGHTPILIVRAPGACEARVEEPLVCKL